MVCFVDMLVELWMVKKSASEIVTLLIIMIIENLGCLYNIIIIVNHSIPDIHESVAGVLNSGGSMELILCQKS